MSVKNSSAGVTQMAINLLCSIESTALVRRQNSAAAAPKHRKRMKTTVRARAKLRKAPELTDAAPGTIIHKSQSAPKYFRKPPAWASIGMNQAAQIAAAAARPLPKPRQPNRYVEKSHRGVKKRAEEGRNPDATPTAIAAAIACGNDPL